VGEGDPAQVVRVLLCRLESEVRGLRVMQPGINIGDNRARGNDLCSDAGIDFSVLYCTRKPWQQVPGEGVPILVESFGGPSRAAAGDLHHFHASPPGALLIGQKHQGIDNIVVRAPEVRLQLDGCALECQRLTDGAAGV
jgi:hypothetical protein